MRSIKYIVSFICLLYSCLVMGETRQHTKIWNTAIIVGSLSDDNKIKYFLQPWLGLMDDAYKFENALMFVGIGYQPYPALTYWLMNGYDVSKREIGNYRHLDIVRQQINWTVVRVETFDFSTTSRLEELKDLNQSEWAVRLRERLTLRLPIKSWENHAFVLYDEMFFNTNHPAWINSNTLVEQNRIFVGVETRLSSQTSLEIGYLNQYLFRTNDANSNVLSLQLNVDR